MKTRIDYIYYRFPLIRVEILLPWRIAALPENVNFLWKQLPFGDICNPVLSKNLSLEILLSFPSQHNPNPHRWPINTELFWLLLNCFHLIYCFISVADSWPICSLLLYSFHLLQSISSKVCKPGPTQKELFITDFFKQLCSPGALPALLFEKATFHSLKIKT